MLGLVLDFKSLKTLASSHILKLSNMGCRFDWKWQSMQQQRTQLVVAVEEELVTWVLVL